MPKCLGPQAFGSDAPALAPRETPFSDPGRSLSSAPGRPLLRSGTSVSSAPGRPASRRPFPPRDAPRGAPLFPLRGALPPRFGVPPLAVAFQLRRLISRRQPPTWESHLLTAALNPEGTSTITRKTGQKTRLFVQSGDSGCFPRPSRHVPQFRHCISPVHHCTYSGYI